MLEVHLKTPFCFCQLLRTNKHIRLKKTSFFKISDMLEVQMKTPFFVNYCVRTNTFDFKKTYFL